MTVVDLYTIQILMDDRYDRTPITDIPRVGDLSETIAETEENLTDLLPPGYRARIRRWNAPDPDERNPDE